ncbi:Uncharacterised protein g5181 [Pycnogonum litorale]
MSQSQRVGNRLKFDQLEQHKQRR